MKPKNFSVLCLPYVCFEMVFYPAVCYVLFHTIAIPNSILKKSIYGMSASLQSPKV